jgi:hypothetical protein
MVNPAHENTPNETSKQFAQDAPETEAVTRHREEWGTLFEGAVLFAYSRAEAIADGVLVDVAEAAQDAGFLLPVAVTAALWADLENIPAGSGQDVPQRLRTLLRAAREAIEQAVASGRGDREEVPFATHLPLPGFPARYHAKSVIGPDDQGKPCLTLMQPFED